MKEMKLFSATIFDGQVNNTVLFRAGNGTNLTTAAWIAYEAQYGIDPSQKREIITIDFIDEKCAELNPKVGNVPIKLTDFDMSILSDRLVVALLYLLQNESRKTSNINEILEDVSDAVDQAYISLLKKEDWACDQKCKKMESEPKSMDELATEYATNAKSFNIKNAYYDGMEFALNNCKVILR